MDFINLRLYADTSDFNSENFGAAEKLFVTSSDAMRCTGLGSRFRG
jgi:hypothetical protein